MGCSERAQRLVVLAILFGLQERCSGFNVDPKFAQVFVGPPYSDFGYAVSLGRSRGVNHVLVGAPRGGDVRAAEGSADGAGALYSCSVDSNRPCAAVPVDTRGVELLPNLLPVETKAGQRLGMTVASSQSGSVITCSPHYLYHRRLGTAAGTHRDPVGNCFITPDFTLYNFTEYSPCRIAFDQFMQGPNWLEELDSYAGYHATGSGMCGFSVAAASSVREGNVFVVGAPGNYYWKGQLYLKNATVNAATRYDGIPEDSYLGYALAMGHFSRDRKTNHILAAMPRQNFTQGRIVVYGSTSMEDVLASGVYRSTSMEDVLASVVGDQPGSYLGYSLAVTDVDGNGVDDIVAGAPMWTDYNTDKYEIGAVYIYRWNQERPRLEFSMPQIVRGHTLRSRFGSAVAAMGDLNLDGAQDVAVGAPYGGIDGRGAVYIYHGMLQGGLREPHVQVIYASDVGGLQIPLTFGWSLASGQDVDNNGYLDLAVGAYKSNTAYLLKSNPIISTSGTVSVQPAAVIMGDDCGETFGAALPAPVVDFNVTICFQFALANGLSEPRRATIRASLFLDSDQQMSKRAFWKSNGLSAASTDISIHAGTVSCTELQAHLTRNAKDKVSPIGVTVSHELVQTSLTGTGAVDAILNGSQQNAIGRAEVTIQKRCAGSMCRPRLAVSAVAAKPYYVAGADESMALEISVANTGEDAYNTSLVVELPNGISYINAAATSACPPILCQQMALSDSQGPTLISCDIGNPLPSGRAANFTLRSRIGDMNRIQSPNLTFGIVASSVIEGQEMNATGAAVILLRAAATVFVAGMSVPNTDVQYNETSIASGGQGPPISHRYEVFTEGPSDVSEAELVIMWPSSLNESGDHLLYLLRPPRIASGTGNCSMKSQHAVLQAPYATTGRTHITDASGKDKYTCADADVDEPCIQIVCSLSSLSRSAPPSVVVIDAALWLGPTFAQLSKDHSRRATIFSVGHARAVTYAYRLLPVESVVTSYHVGSYFEKYKATVEVVPLDWKWIAIGAGSGLLFLIVIIIVLWRCGFFKRDRPPTFTGVVEKERAPLSSEDSAATEAQQIVT